MGTTAQKLLAILNSKAAIKTAIEDKGVTVGSAKLSEYAGLIGEISGGSEPEEVEWKDVNFIDYDGTTLLSYTAEEFLALNAMPTYPVTHVGLTFVEWNWTLSVAQNYVWKYKYLVVGATLTSSDGSTRVTINIQDESLLTVKLAFRQSKTNGVLIDWGDGSTAERFAGTDFTAIANRKSHTYPRLGRYTITYTPDSGCNFSPTTGTYGGPFGYYYASEVQKITNSIESIVYGTCYNGWNNLFTSSTNLKEVVGNLNFYGMLGTTYAPLNLKGLVIPKYPRAETVTLNNVGNGAFDAKAIAFPETAILLAASMCNNCQRIKIASIPPNVKGITNQASLFAGCYSLEHVVFPEGLNMIYNTWCSNNYSLKEIIIPDTVTAIGQSASAGSAFQWCINAKKLRLSNNLTIIPLSTFNACVSLEEIIIPEGVTTIGNTAFYQCQSAKKIVVPSTVTSIGNSAFYIQYDQGNGKLEGFYIKATTPPTLGTTAFSKAAATPAYTIYVPKGSLSAYQSASNWSAFASFMQEYDFTRVECKFNVTSTSSATQILSSTALSSTTSIEVEGTTISPTTTYTFSSTGEHIVKYKFTDSTKVPANAFTGCSQLVDVEFPTNVVTIDGYSFSGTGLTKVTIPKWITTIQYNAFGSCPVLKTVVMESTTPPTMTSAFGGNATGRKFYVLKSCLSTYKGATGWSTYASDIVEMRYWGI